LSIQSVFNKILIIEGESREGVVVVSCYRSEVEKGLFVVNGTSSLYLKKMTLNHSYTSGLNRSLIDFMSDGIFELNELTIQQGEGIVFIFCLFNHLLIY
jgi:hypothetical protein